MTSALGNYEALQQAMAGSRMPYGQLWINHPVGLHDMEVEFVM